MHKKLLLFLFITAILTLTQFAAADYTLTNGTAENVWVVYSRWLPASSNWPEGWRTQGYYKIAPGATKELSIPAQNRWVYIFVEGPGGRKIKPLDHATRDSAPFWIHPKQPFTVVENNDGDFLKSNRVKWNLEQVDLYKYRNGRSHTIVDEPRLPDLPARQIYNQAMSSVVWIETLDNNHNYLGKGSGVLIDQERKLVVTNAHVIRGAADIYVFFPWKNQNGALNRKEDFYLENWEWLENRRYASEARIISQNIRNDVAIIQLDQLSPVARKIKHDFSKNVEDSLKKGDKVHVLGNPGNRLWDWGQGTFVNSWKDCLPSKGDCLELEANIHGGNSGGPVLNGQGMLVGIITATDNETVGLAAPARNVKALLSTVPTNLRPIPPPQQIYPKRVFKIRNNTGVTVRYQIRWSSNNNWQSYSLETGFVRTHTSSGQNVPSGYPKIRFDHIAGDNRVTYRQYTLETALFRENNNDNAPTRRFQYNWAGDRLDLVRDTGAASSQQTYPKRTFKVRNNTGVLVPYEIRWSNNNDWKRHSIEKGFVVTHWSGGQNIPSGYPKIRFDHIAGDGQVTYRTYKLETALFRENNNDHAPTYYFQYNRWGDRLDLLRDVNAAPTLSKAVPKETELLSNYPNPFNPETWIPYQLSKSAEVTVTIHAVDGRLIRTLALGHQPAGVYQSKSRAVYWDGRNELGEPVASGVYFYTLKAGDFTATRKMLIRK